MLDRTRLRKLKRWLGWASASSLVVLGVTLLVLWMMFQHIPEWYVPVEVSSEDLPRVRRESSRWIDGVSDKIVRRRTFEIELQEFEVNQLLTALPDVMPDADRYRPQEVVAPVVSFHDGYIRVAVRLVQDLWQCIVTIDLSIEVTEDGRYLILALREVHGGSLSIPRNALQRAFGPELEEARKSAPGGRSSSPWSEAFRDVDHVSKLYDGLRVRNSFTWPNGKRRFRIESITVVDGVLKVVIDPL